MDYNQLILSLGLIALGLGLLAAVLFIPSAGLITVAALVAIGAGVAVPFWYGDTTAGFLTLLAVFIILPIFGAFLMNYWPKTRMGRRMMLPGPEDDAAQALAPVNLELERLRGRVGRAVSLLRPAGVVDFDGQHVDCLSESILVEPGTWVRCLDVKPGRVLVRPIDEPDLRKLENADFS
jgi:membrane-bound serine protease (ClpP class)